MATRLFDITLANILVLILLIAQVHLVHSQDVQWPIHTVCNSERLTITYRSCECSFKHLLPSYNVYRSVHELYSSAVLLLNGYEMLTWNEPLCLPHFQRFTFCGSRRGEIMTLDSSFQLKTDIPLKGYFTLLLNAINQDGFQIACVNATLSFK
ncbi:lymphocyte antigen 86 isoform X2 [Triplophysa rosa]|uniref:lymphocyte antigen 86 isoform X2 n=1 Tax=Triplophysa rosa TaxID=992332 RepID=UPI0025463052|nr:lymphocyte antigen 86 isoform X2 [Triplophysa rosa]